MLIDTSGTRASMCGWRILRRCYRSLAARSVASPLELRTADASRTGGRSVPDQPLLLNDEIAVVHVGNAVSGVEQIAATDREPDRPVPVIPPLLVPYPDGKAERIAAFRQRQRAEA